MTRRWRVPGRDRIVDLVGIGSSAMLGLVAGWDAYQSGRIGGGELAAAAVLGGAGCAALWWRRRRPVTVSVLLALACALTELPGGAALISVYTVAANRRRRVTAAIVALHVVLSVPYARVRPDPDLGVAGSIVLGVVAMTVAAGIGAVVRSRRRLATVLRERTARAEAEAEAYAERLRAQERQRIAREMHDVLAHRISQVSLYAGALEIRRDLDAAEVSRVAGAIRTGAHQALEDLREILGVLRADTALGADGAPRAGIAPRADIAGIAPRDDGAPRVDGGALRPPPDLTCLAELLTECRAAGALLEVDDRLSDPAAVPPVASRAGYRLVQEGLTNARKHAPGAPVRVRLERTRGGELHLWLANPVPLPGSAAGTSTAGVPGARSGLVGLAERVALAGGRIDHGARRDPDGGVAFHLEAWLPWPT